MRSTRMILLRTIAAELVEHSIKDADWLSDLEDVLESMGYRLAYRRKTTSVVIVPSGNWGLVLEAIGDVDGNQ